MGILKLKETLKETEEEILKVLKEVFEQVFTEENWDNFNFASEQFTEIKILDHIPVDKLIMDVTNKLSKCC